MEYKIVLYVLATILVFLLGSAKSDCDCHPVPKEFNETVKDVVGYKCRKCYEFTYDFMLDEDWAPSLCVSSPLVSSHTPLLVVAREYLHVTSFQVPQLFEDERKSSFTDVCRMLCPLANYFDDRLNASKQHIFVEVSTQSVDDVEFEVRLSTVNNFVVVKDQPLTVNITPSQPRVMQYNMEDDLRAVRIEAESSDAKCMILSIEDIQCPFFDSELTVESTGFYQTLMTKSGISVTKRAFSMGRVYVVLILKTSNRVCTGSTESYESPTLSAQYLSKEVTVRIVPAITDGQYYLAVFVVLVPYILAYLISLFVCICKSKKRKGNFGVEEGGSTLGSINNPSEYGTGINNETSSKPLALPTDQLVPVTNKTTIFLSDLAKKREDVLSKRSKLYLWNLVAIAVYFSVPAFQLVAINQGIVNLTGNQDLCYFNFLCSYQLGRLTDFNHFYSNIGYVLLGVLFLLIVRRRELIYRAAASERLESGMEEAVGVPYHFGLFYAMGCASIMEGVLSATYHVCPNKSNFQFDTAFMYVIVTMCMLRLYQARHPDITAKAHTIWIYLSVVVFVNGGDVMIIWPKLRIAYHVIFSIVYLLAAFLVSVKIYYMGCEKFNRGILKHVFQNRSKAAGTYCCGFYHTEYRVQFFTFLGVMLINIICVIFHLVTQGDFASFFLQVFILNLLIYFGYYILMKKKSGLNIPASCMVLAMIFWGAAIVYFVDANSEWQLTPAESRELNSHCYLLNFYDHHDMWHLLSSFAIFFSFMVLLTMDDDQQNEPRSQIKVF